MSLNTKCLKYLRHTLWGATPQTLSVLFWSKGVLFGIFLLKKTSYYLKKSNAVLLLGYVAVDGILLYFLRPCHQMIVCVNWNGHLWNYIVISFLLIYSTILFPIKSPSSLMIPVHLYLLVPGNTPYQFFRCSQQSIPYITLFWQHPVHVEQNPFQHSIFVQS